MPCISGEVGVRGALILSLVVILIVMVTQTRKRLQKYRQKYGKVSHTIASKLTASYLLEISLLFFFKYIRP